MYTHSNKSDLIKMIDEEIDLVEMINTLKRYKKSIYSVAASVTFLTLIYIYFSTSVYEAALTLQVQDKTPVTYNNADDQFMNQALDNQGANADNEMALIQSASVIRKAIEPLNLWCRYYSVSSFKTREMYKNTSPFKVDAEFNPMMLEGYRFHVRPLDKNRFNLSIEPSSKMKIASAIGVSPNGQPVIHFSKDFTYGAMIAHPWFKMIISKQGEFGTYDYYFTLTSNENIAFMVQQSLTTGLTAEKSSIITLNYQDNLPERAQDILHALAEAYLMQSVETKNTGASKSLEFIDKQLAQVNAALENSAKNLELFKSSHIVIDPKDKGAIATQKLSDYEAQMYEVNMQESILQNLQTYMKNNKDLTGIDVGAINMVMNSPLQTLIQSLQEAHNQKAALVVDYTDKHPSVIKINQQIIGLKTNLEQTIASNLQGVQQRKTSLNQIIAQNRADLAAIPFEEKQLSQLNNSFVVNQKVYEYLLQKRAETAIIESSNVSGTRIVDDAAVGVDPVKPKKLLVLLVGIILGFLAGIGQALFRNYLDDTIQSISDVEKGSVIPLVSVLPLFGDKKSLYQDALRVLLTKLEYHPTGTEKPKIINFTASIHGEGRTTTAVEFAQVAALSGKKVIILDMDMRSPSVHQKLEIEHTNGIDSYISGKNTLEQVIRKTSIDGLQIITSGNNVAGSYELIMSQQFKTLLGELKEKYDYVFIVSPQVGVVADTLLLMRLSELNLFVFKAEYSKRSFIKNINRFVEEHHFDNAGVILNGLELKKIRPWQSKR